MSFQSMGSGRTESSFSDMSISGGGSGTGFGLSTNAESFSRNSKENSYLLFTSIIRLSTTAPPNGRDMQLVGDWSESGHSFQNYPNMNKQLFTNENILGLKDPNRPLPTGQAGDAGVVGLLKGRMQSANESMVPLSINCWPSFSGNETYVSIKFAASSMFDFRNVVIPVPLPALREAPSVRQNDVEWK
ncbi:hypothetical protein Pint_12188 [Pistacia integerrima]|uniref:Uncharacterized protein n=1 Tax=Pistacia integerrima TaxID=434235 RepID=A0ACC0XKB9_9ROSI|nr:hypothetical protein Pint_12188 [Pistacia integerrima]